MLKCLLHYCFNLMVFTILISFDAEALSRDSVDEFLSHRAFYKMSAIKIAPSSPIVNIEGRLSFELREFCDSWTVEQSYIMVYQRDNGSEKQINTFLSSWEQKEGNNYKFFVKRENSDTGATFIEGTAVMPQINGEGTVDFEKPESKQFTLDKKTLFPSKHTLALINAAKRKQKIFQSFIFDGTEVEPSVLVSSIIGPQKTFNGDVLELEKGQYWPIRMAFFSPAEKQIEPEYEITINLHSNGVVSALILDYGDIIIDVELVELNFLEHSFCK